MRPAHRSQRGFTLLEVLVALAVLAIALGAIIKAAAISADNVGQLRDRTLASWVAANTINATLLARDWPELGVSRGSAEMAGRQWRWELRVTVTPDPDMRRLDITVSGTDEDTPDGPTPLVQVAAFQGINR